MQELLYQDSVSIRALPANFNQADSRLFEHELKRVIPATVLLNLRDVAAYPTSTLFQRGKVLPESFPSPRFMDTWVGPKSKSKFLVSSYLLRYRKRLEQDVFWITDTWSQGYFHWMTDALPRLFAVREKIGGATLLLPGPYNKEEYVGSSLKPFFIQDLKFIHEAAHCKSLRMPTHTAPTGNYNESIINSLRSLYTGFYQDAQSVRAGNKIYVSRGKAQKRRIVNEEECVETLEEYGFKTVHFEDHSFEQQVEIALNARYLISNHGAGLTNILFMKSGSKVLELRQDGDAHNNCYFALASALHLTYFYQLCRSENPGEDAHTANLTVDCHSLKKNIEQMLAD